MAIALGVLRARKGVLAANANLDDLAAKVAGGELDPYSAADELVAMVSPANPPYLCAPAACCKVGRPPRTQVLGYVDLRPLHPP